MICAPKSLQSSLCMSVCLFGGGGWVGGEGRGKGRELVNLPQVISETWSDTCQLEAVGKVQAGSCLF